MNVKRNVFRLTTLKKVEILFALLECSSRMIKRWCRAFSNGRAETEKAIGEYIDGKQTYSS